MSSETRVNSPEAARKRDGLVYKASARIWLTMLVGFFVSGGGWINLIRLRSPALFGAMSLNFFLSFFIAMAVPVETDIFPSDIEGAPITTEELAEEPAEDLLVEDGELSDEASEAVTIFILRMFNWYSYMALGNFLVVLYAVWLTGKAREELDVTGEQARDALRPRFNSEGKLLVGDESSSNFTL